MRAEAQWAAQGPRAEENDSQRPYPAGLTGRREKKTLCTAQCCLVQIWSLSVTLQVWSPFQPLFCLLTPKLLQRGIQPALCQHLHSFILFL